MQFRTQRLYKMKQSFSCSSLGLALILLYASLDPILCGVHYIVPETNSSCNADSCLTLSQLADSSTSYFDENTTLFIVGGNHYLDREIRVSHIEAFAMIGLNSSITCSDLAKFTFTSINRVHINGLTFISCSGNRVAIVDQLTVERTVFWGQSNSRTSIIISGSNATILESSFLSNTVGNCETDVNYYSLSTDSRRSSCTTVGGTLIIIRSHSSLITAILKGTVLIWGVLCMHRTIALSKSVIAHLLQTQ